MPPYKILKLFIRCAEKDIKAWDNTNINLAFKKSMKEINVKREI